VLLAALAAVCFLVEGAMLDWSALLLTGRGLAATAQGGLGYAFFAVAMTTGRLGGDAITARFGDRAAMLWGGIGSLLGFVVLLLGTRLEIALAGFVLIGLGASNIVPVLFRRAGNVPGGGRLRLASRQPARGLLAAGRTDGAGTARHQPHRRQMMGGRTTPQHPPRPSAPIRPSLRRPPISKPPAR